MRFCIKLTTYYEFPVRVEFPDDGVLYQDTGFQSGGASQHQSGDVVYTEMETYFYNRGKVKPLSVNIKWWTDNLLLKPILVHLK